MTELGIYVELTQTRIICMNTTAKCVWRSMYATLRVTTLTSPALLVIFLYFAFKPVCKLVWAFTTFPVIRFQTSGTLLLRFVVSSCMVTLSDLCLFPPSGLTCWQADLFALWPGYGWGIGGSTQANTFLCPTLNWLSSDINFLSLLDSVREHCSLNFSLSRGKYNKQYLHFERNGSSKKCWGVWNTDLMSTKWWGRDSVLWASELHAYCMLKPEWNLVMTDSKCSTYQITFCAIQMHLMWSAQKTWPEVDSGSVC